MDAIIDRRMKACKTEVDREVHGLRVDVRALHERVETLAEDVHGITRAVSDMSASLEKIAAAIGKLSDLPETWDKIKGFWAVMTWLRGNLLPVATLFILVAWIASQSDLAGMLRGLMP